MQTILSIIGTRPEAIKMAPVLRQLAAHAAHFHSIVAVTGQHRQMLDQVLDLFGMVPDHDLDVMRPNQTLAGLTSQLFAGIDRLVSDVRPDWVLAQGDTTTVFAAAMVAFYRDVRFGHVEAGLRTGDKRRPFPEEVNRRITSIVADLHFAPTERARLALLREDVGDTDIVVTGNTVVDAVTEIAARPYDWSTSPLATIPANRRLVTITAHRRESFGEPFLQLCKAIRELAIKFQHEGVHFVYPVHLNPNVRTPVMENLVGCPNVQLIEPINYEAMVHLMKHSDLILTDSGGIQEEAPSLGVPVLVMRDTTERPEGVEAGLVRLVGTNSDKIVAEATQSLLHHDGKSRFVAAVNPYGDGRAAERIVARLLDHAS